MCTKIMDALKLLEMRLRAAEDSSYVLLSYEEAKELQKVLSVALDTLEKTRL